MKLMAILRGAWLIAMILISFTFNNSWYKFQQEIKDEDICD